MLRRLSIRHYALIESIEWDCESGWTVLTGETGSGKSILLGALGLILGDRADGTAPFQQEKCIVEAEFSLSPAAREMIGDWDDGGDCIIRRTIAPGGRSRAFINDEPVKLNLLKSLAPLLVDLHGQQDGQRLHGSEGLLNAIDRFDAEAGVMAVEWQSRYAAWHAACKRLRDLSGMTGMPQADEDYLRFQLEELADVDFHDPNLRDLDARLDRLAHAKDIQHALGVAADIIQGTEGDVLSRLRSAEQALEKVSPLFQGAAALAERIRSCRIELEDAAAEAENAAEGIDMDPAAMAAAEADRNRINRLLDKHRAADLDELEERHAAMASQLEEARQQMQERAVLEKEIEALRTALDDTGTRLQAARSKGADALSKAILEHLVHLKMPAAQLAFQWSPIETPEASGPSRVSMAFSANPGVPMQPLTKVASGGERSRVMLALKAALNQHLEVPTLILDEIDAGVSGDVAARMADLIASISRTTQVITISHLPQVAGKADHHFKVLKEEREGRAITRMQPLSDSGRIEELATMLSGEEVGDAARAQARSLLT